MMFMHLILGTVFLCVSQITLAQSTIFNIQQPIQPQLVPADTAPAVLPPVHKSQTLIGSPDTGDQKPTPQYGRVTNESNDAYLKRLNSMTKKSVEDMERISRDHNERMKALAPK